MPEVSGVSWELQKQSQLTDSIKVSSGSNAEDSGDADADSNANNSPPEKQSAREIK